MVRRKIRYFLLYFKGRNSQEIFHLLVKGIRRTSPDHLYLRFMKIIGFNPNYMVIRCLNKDTEKIVKVITEISIDGMELAIIKKSGTLKTLKQYTNLLNTS